MDIGFCSGEHGDDDICPKRDTCLRYIYGLDEDKWSLMQGFDDPAPYIQKVSGVSCEAFWSVNNKD